MFGTDPKARGDLSPGTLYAVACADGRSIFYGQVCRDKTFGFFRVRHSQLSDTGDVITTPVMSRFGVSYPSVGAALRSGAWKKLGRTKLADELDCEGTYVQWPVFTTDAQVWRGSDVVRATRAEDPAIQHLEIIAAWDAEHHVPLRLLVDFAPEEAATISEVAWSVGGPVWRQRRVREEMARRFPGGPHALPEGWVPTTDKGAG
jgi:hypothetical protein